MYRGININLSPVMKQKYDTYETSFAVGTKITFPAPTSCTTSDHIASEFTHGIQLMIQNQSGVMMVPGHLSAFEEDEVMPPFPSSYKVVARSKVQDTVVVVIQALTSAVTYCSPHASGMLHDLSGVSPHCSHTHDVFNDDGTPVYPPTTQVLGGGSTTMASVSSPVSVAYPSLSVKQVSLLVCLPSPMSSIFSSCLISLSPQLQSVKPAFSKYATAVAERDVTGVVLSKSSDEELDALFNEMKISTSHKVEIREAVARWRADPQGVRFSMFSCFFQ